MSTPQNDGLIEQAREVAERWTGTMVEDAILNALDRGDLEMAQFLVNEAEKEEDEQEARKEAQDEMTDERAEDMFSETLIGEQDVY